jgi:hypothetical protein
MYYQPWPENTFGNRFSIVVHTDIEGAKEVFQPRQPKSCAPVEPDECLPSLQQNESPRGSMGAVLSEYPHKRCTWPTAVETMW